MTQLRFCTTRVRSAAALVLYAFVSMAACAGQASDQVSKGKYLADIGGCVSCHTAPKGQPFAGGLYMDTPYGPISTPNITPDGATGIGTWSDSDFYRAMHDGIGKHGEYLYPVMPFPYYTKLSRADVASIRAYLKTLAPVNNPRLPNQLRFPFSVRESLLAWRAVFFKAGEFKPTPGQSAQIARGDYLVNGLAHCGECHNARPVAGQSKYDKAFQGGVIDDWYAPNITGDARDGIGGWSDSALVTYLKTGVTPDKGVALGPMAETVENLSHATPQDLEAMVAYLKSTKPTEEPHQRLALYKGQNARGADVYLDNCASCHGVKGNGIAGVVADLRGNGSVTAKGPEDVIQVVLGGAEAHATYAPMPAVGASMSDEDVAEVTNFVRQLGKNAAPGTAEAGTVGKLRKESQTLMNGAPQSSCPPLEDPAVAKAVDASGIAANLRTMTEAQMLETARTSVQKVKKERPDIAPASLINGIVTTYCGTLHADASLAPAERAARIGQFAELVYTEASPSSSYHPR